ncbi:MAG: carboxymuconolactone decarboxylase family protein [Christensenellales bacterium]
MDRIRQTEKNNRAWFGGQCFAGHAYDPEFDEIAQRFLCGDVLNHGTLTDKQRALILLTALGRGVKPEEIKETLYQCAPYIGLEKVQCALDEVSKAFEQAKVPYPKEKQGRVCEETRFEKGLAVQQQIFGKEHINAMREAAPAELKHIQDYLSAYCFGDFYTRETLDLQMRELITFCAICCLGGCEP